MKIGRVSFVLIALLTLSGAKAQAQPKHEVDFYLLGEKIFLDAYILDSNKVTCLFDLGTYAYLHSGTAQKHSISYTKTGRMRSADKTSNTNMFGNFGVQFSGLTDTFKTVRSQATAPYENRRVDFVFGKEWADRYTVHINYNRMKIELYEPSYFSIHKTPKGYTELDIIGWTNYPVVKSWFKFDTGDSIEINVALNCGSEVGFLLDKYIVRKHDIHKIQKDRGNIRIYGADGQGLEGMLTRMKSVQVGPMRRFFYRGGVFEDGYSQKNGEFVQGQIGQPMLKWYSTIYDPINRRVWVKSRI